LMNYKKISHGQAVAYGMIMAAKLAFMTNKIDKDYYDLIVSLVNKFKLVDFKLKFKKEQLEEFKSLMLQDKKVNNGKVNLLLPVSCSAVELFDNIDLPSIGALLP